MKTALLVLGMTLAAAADDLGDALAKHIALQQGRVRFETKLDDGTMQKATIVFQRPDKLHYWAQTDVPNQAPIQTHCWLAEKRLMVWNSKMGPSPEAATNVYTVVNASDGLAGAPTHRAMGPANYLSLLLSGQRDFFELNPTKHNDEPASVNDAFLWISNGDFLILEAPTILLKEVNVWRKGKEFVCAKVSFDSDPPKPEELTWTLPADAKPLNEE